MLFCCFLPIVLQGQTIKTIAGTGTAGYSGDGNAATAAKLKTPDAVKFDRLGNLYVADEGNHAIRKINTAGIIYTVAGTGTGTTGYSGDGGPATMAKLARPADIAFDLTDNMYIAEFGNGTIRKVSTTGIITTIAGTGIPGYSGDNGPATTAQLFDPFGLVIDAIGNIYFSDNSKYRVRKISTTGIITTIAGTGIAGYNGDNGPATAAQINLTGYLAISPAGELYIPDYYNRRIRKIDAAGIITTVVGNGTGGNTGDGGPATAATIGSMFAIFFDPTGNMYLSDRANGVIRKVNTSGIISTIAGIGSLGYGGDGGPATAAQFNIDVYCSAMDGIGNLYIADPLNNRVRKIVYHPEAVNDINTILQHVSIFPNPAHDEVTVAWEGGSVQAGNEVTIVNIAGQAVISECHMGSSVSLHTGKLPAGVYIVTVNGAYAGRFVKE